MTINFPGGAVAANGFPQSHNGPTPTTLNATPITLDDDMSDAVTAIGEADKLIVQGRKDEARHELKAAVRCIEHALGLLE